MPLIGKAMSAKHQETLAPFVDEFCKTACELPHWQLRAHLESFPTRWQYPRGDLYHWIELLDHFEKILWQLCALYALDKGPQKQPFDGTFLRRSGAPAMAERPDGRDADEELVLAILDMTYTLLVNCGNRSIYASSTHLNSLLNSTSLAVLEKTLRVGGELAMRYQAAFKRSSHVQHGVNRALLLNHYNIRLEKVLKLALPFSRDISIPADPVTPGSVYVTPKGKERASTTGLPDQHHHQRERIVTVFENDLVALASEAELATRGGKSGGRRQSEKSGSDWGDIRVTYLPTLTEPEPDNLRRQSAPASATSPAAPASPNTPTPVRRGSNLGPNGSRAARSSTSDDPSTPTRAMTMPADEPQSAFKTVSIPASRWNAPGRPVSVSSLMSEIAQGLPEDVEYELFTKLRVATAVTTSVESRRQALVVRLLAITNLAYIYVEEEFMSKVLKQDNEEPQRMQLPYQLANLIHPPTEGSVPIPMFLQSVALYALDALAASNTRFHDVCKAIQTPATHGVLMCVMREVVKGIRADHGAQSPHMTDQELWQSGLSTLLITLCQVPRTASDMLNAGLIQNLVSILQVRNPTAERYYPTVLAFLDQLMYTARDAFATLVTGNGLDAISKLIVDEVTIASAADASNPLMASKYRAPSCDYQITFTQQQALKFLFKFIRHVMASNGGFGANSDRLLRNLIDSAPLLESLREILSHPRRYGSNIWTNTVGILNDFINNEPTSFSIIAEAGLGKAVLETITGSTITTPVTASADDQTSTTETAPTAQAQQPSEPSPDRKPAGSIMASAEVLSIIPQTLSALCLNHAGMAMLTSSEAIPRFLEIFESPEHIKCMHLNRDLAVALGASFDELIRHQPTLKPIIVAAVRARLLHVNQMCREPCQEIADQQFQADFSVSPNAHGADIDMQDVDAAPVVPETKKPAKSETLTHCIHAFANFLQSLLASSTVCAEFSAGQGYEHILDLAEAPCLPGPHQDTSTHKVVQSLVACLISKPHLVIPSLLRRARDAADALAPFASFDDLSEAEHGGRGVFFEPLLRASAPDHNHVRSRAPDFSHAFQRLVTLLQLLRMCLQHQSPFDRTRVSYAMINSINVGDLYVDLIRKLGPLVVRCMREARNCQILVPVTWTVESNSRGPDGQLARMPLGDRFRATRGADGHGEDRLPDFDEKTTSVGHDNYTKLWEWVIRLPHTAQKFMQVLGRSILNKRCSEIYQRQTHVEIARAMADVLVLLLEADRRSIIEGLADHGTTRIVLNMVEALLIEENRGASERPVQIIAAVLQEFVEKDGFVLLHKIMKSLVESLHQEVAANRASGEDKSPSSSTQQLQRLLSIYAVLVNGKYLTESSQAAAMFSRQDRERTGANVFKQAQLLVEVRMAIMPDAQALWEDEALEDMPVQICKDMIEIARQIAAGEGESGCFKRSDGFTHRTPPPHKRFLVHEDLAKAIAQEDATEEQLQRARHAVYRCHNNLANARELCQESRHEYPVAEAQLEKPAATQEGEAPTETAPESMDIDSVATADGDDADASAAAATEDQGNGSSAQDVTSTASTEADDTRRKIVCQEDLQEAREFLRGDSLIYRCLDIVNAHGEVTFEIADVMSTATKKSADPHAQRQEMADLVIVSLTSFSEDDLESVGGKIAAYAHLLALLLRDKDFFYAASPQLLESLSTLLSFVRLPAEHDGSKGCPWIVNVLLVVEMLLAEDARPLKTTFHAPLKEDDELEEPTLEMRELVVGDEERDRLVENMLELMPRVGKDEALALAILRVLVILSRKRATAQILGAKQNLQKLFVMAKQITGLNTSRVTGPMLIVLRHVIEDPDTIKQIMRSDISVLLENPRPTGRHLERGYTVHQYLKDLAPHVLRAPELFVEVTQEIVKLNRWQYNPEASGSRTPTVQLKPSARLAIRGTEDAEEQKDKASKDEDKNDERKDLVQPAVQGTEDLTIQDVKTTTEDADKAMPDAPSKQVTEARAAFGNDSPDGVIHFILSELLSYKDVVDREPSTAVAEKSATSSDIVAPAADSVTSTAPNEQQPAGTDASAASAKVDASSTTETSTAQPKESDYPIHVYRCFLLQCLSEMLHSYSRCKLEFINFKRGAPPSAAGSTPSRHRTSLINYILYNLLPPAFQNPPTTSEAATAAYARKLTTALLAKNVLLSLVNKDGEQPQHSFREVYAYDKEADLQFVRRFFVDSLLKAFKDVTNSADHFEIKYPRIMSMAALMCGLIGVPAKDARMPPPSSTLTYSQHQMRRLMFEKGYVNALTAAVAEIDPNIEGPKHSMKHLIQPLAYLTRTAIDLCHAGHISETPKEGEADEIELASSVSDLDEEREETPDLFRNSALGMFEQDDGEESLDEEDDEDMYEGEYGDEMEYPDLQIEESSDVSDEDEEEMEGMDEMGDIEGLDGDHNVDVEVIMEDDPDDDDHSHDSDDSVDDEGDSDSDDSDDSDDVIEENEIGFETLEDVEGTGEATAMGADDDDDDMDEEWESDHDDDEDDEVAYPHGPELGAHAGHDMLATMNHMPPINIASQLLRSINQNVRDATDNVLSMAGPDLDAAEAEHAHVHDDEDDVVDASHLWEEMDGMDDDEDEDDEDEDDEEEDMLFGGAAFMGGGPMGELHFDGDTPQPVIVSHHSRPHRHRNNPVFIPEARDHPLMDFSAMRSHRHNPPPPPEVDGVNPLLHRRGSNSTGRTQSGSSRPRLAAPGGGPLAQLQEQIGPMMEAILSQNLDRHMRNGHHFQFHISGPPGEIPAELQAMFGRGSARSPRDQRRDAGDATGSIGWPTQTTKARWEEEAKILFASAHWTPQVPNQRSPLEEKAMIMYGAIHAVLVPPAIEEDKRLKAQEKELQRKEEEERQAKLEQEKVAREAREAEQKAAQEKKEAEEREAADRLVTEAAALAVARAQAELQNQAEGTAQSGETDHLDAMEGVEAAEPDTNTSAAPAEPAAEATTAPPAALPRVTTRVRGRDVPITDLGIDPDFLAELPDDIREEVVMSTFVERRSRVAASNEAPSTLEQEFLDALPEDMREELMASERQERRRREREEQRRQQQATGAPVGPQEMDNADFLITLAPALRTQVLLEQDEEMLATLPQDLANQARMIQAQHGARHARHQRPIVNPTISRDLDVQRLPRRSVVSMLDRPGVATLMRLMYVQQTDTLRDGLNQLLLNVCQNKANRGEIISTILSILLDGSADVTAINRCFSQLTARSKPIKESEPKTPQMLKRSLTGNLGGSGSAGAIVTTDAKPLMVVQQCLHALVSLAECSAHVQSFFLTEHEVTGAIRRGINKKHKGKDAKANKFALNAVLSLLDRESMLENATIIDALTNLLEMITRPLQYLTKASKEPEAAKAVAAGAQDNNAGSTSEADAAAAPNADNATATSAPQDEGADTAATTTTGDATTTDGPSTTDAGNAQASAATTEETAKPDASTTKDANKKQKATVPPVVPDQYLKLIINIFISRECVSNPFRKALNTIKNLSVIPGARRVFGYELISKAKILGESVSRDLDLLLPKLEKAESDIEIQDVALAKFTPESSDQRGLLRLLTALSYLFEPKEDKTPAAGGKDSETTTPQLDEHTDLLSSLYDHAVLTAVWNKLSACLHAIKQREQLSTISTILLPLIEALMIVCRTKVSKEPLKLIKENALMSPVPESRMDNLFLSFTEEHRKILNDLVRQQPKLMSGSFRVLVKNPKVLEFDNKRNYFTRNIHDSRQQAPTQTNTLQLAVRRSQVFHDSFKALYFQSAQQMKYGKLNIRFHGEEGVDAGGVTREWFQVLSRQMFDPGYALFIPVSSDRTTFHPNQLSSINEEHLLYFKFIGRIIGKALYEGRLLDCHFSRAVYKRILGKSVSVKDMESLDPDYYKSLVWMLENDITDIITETFSVDNDKFGVVETIDFIPDGRNVAVTEDNKHEYVRLMVEWRLTGSVKEQLDEFLRGFHDIIPASLISIFNEQELELLISGLPDINIDDWKGNTEYHNYTASSPQIQWFWRAVRSFDVEERAKLLQFVTGTSKVPLNGFKELEGMNGFSRFNIHRDYGDKERLPSSHTCFNQLDLPEYESYETLRKVLLLAITQGSEYFGFA